MITYVKPEDVPEGTIWHYNHHRLGILCYETKQPLYGTMNADKVKCQKCLTELQALIDYEDNMIKECKRLDELEKRYTEEMKATLLKMREAQEALKSAEQHLKTICFHSFYVPHNKPYMEVCEICYLERITKPLPF